VYIPRGMQQRRLHKAFLRYHDAANWPLLREALKRMGRSDLIGNGKRHLVPTWQPAGTTPPERGGSGATRPVRTQHARVEGADLRRGSSREPSRNRRKP
jgi:hypothetical protein